MGIWTFHNDTKIHEYTPMMGVIEQISLLIMLANFLEVWHFSSHNDVYDAIMLLICWSHFVDQLWWAFPEAFAQMLNVSTSVSASVVDSEANFAIVVPKFASRALCCVQRSGIWLTRSADALCEHRGMRTPKYVYSEIEIFRDE